MPQKLPSLDLLFRLKRRLTCSYSQVRSYVVRHHTAPIEFWAQLAKSWKDASDTTQWSYSNHTIFVSDKWHADRRALVLEIEGLDLVSWVNTWHRVAHFVGAILMANRSILIDRNLQNTMTSTPCAERMWGVYQHCKYEGSVHRMNVVSVLSIQPWGMWALNKCGECIKTVKIDIRDSILKITPKYNHVPFIKL